MCYEVVKTAKTTSINTLETPASVVYQLILSKTGIHSNGAATVTVPALFLSVGLE